MKKLKYCLLAILCPAWCWCQGLTVKGKIINEETLPVAGATISIAGTNLFTSSQDNGEFILTGLSPVETLAISAVGYEPYTQKVNSGDFITVMLKRKINELDEAVVIAYGKTTRRLNTGNVSRITAKDISIQPVSNPLAALEGRVPGLTVSQASGLPGASVKLQLRGQNSLTQGSEPLFIIDGVPFAPGNDNTNLLSSMLTIGNSGLSPFSSLNPADIESIEILKDADATAIYGSRGANGVILITTKKGHAGKTAFTINYNTGWSRVTRTADMLNSQQYLQMRHEAFANDSIAPTITTAPDLLAWDTTRYTDFKKMLLGGTAQIANAQASVSGGDELTHFLVSASAQKQTTVFPGSMGDIKGTLLASISHNTGNQKFTSALSLNYGVDHNTLAAAGLAGFINLPPNTPALYTPDGKLNWEENGASFINPLAYLQRTYSALTDNLVSRLQLGYRLFPGLHISTSIGYNTMNVEEKLLTPIAAQNPATDPKGASSFGFNRFKSWIAEPQLNFEHSIAKGRLELMVGATWQQTTNNGLTIKTSGYTNDAILQSIVAAPDITFRSNTVTDYRYQAFFGRIHYNYDNKYLLNFSGRRDGSSRFGPGKQFAGFGAVGLAWLFANETFIKENLPFLSFGKLRGSYGTTGNDQIGDYNYLDAWGVVPAYQNQTALYPVQLFNPYYGWELSKKLESAIELGFLNNRLLLSASGYLNRSSSQLVQYLLPSQTGFYSITDNFPALVQNKGLELELSFDSYTAKNFSWKTNINLTFQRNKLLAFPGITSSAYASSYLVGQPLNLIYKLKSQGVDPITGLFQFEDADKNGAIQSPGDFQLAGNLTPQYFGGMGNTIRYKEFTAMLFVTFKKQKGANYLNNIYGAGAIPGSAFNQPAYVLDRWRQPGDITNTQRFTASSSSPAYSAIDQFISSDAIYSDASFIRLKTVELAFDARKTLLAKWKINALRLYVQGQNLLTFTHYQGADPENQNLYTLPPLRTLIAGIQLTF